MLARELAALLLEHPDYEVEVCWSQQEPTGEHQRDEPVIIASDLLDKVFLTGEQWVAECLVDDDIHWLDVLTRPNPYADR